MWKFRALVLIGLYAVTLPASACQQILVEHPGIGQTAEMLAEAVVTSSLPDLGRQANRLDPARILTLRLTKVLKGKAPEVLQIPTSPCYVGDHQPGQAVTLVRFPGAEYHLVERPQR
jgi:hypothetical protein